MRIVYTFVAGMCLLLSSYASGAWAQGKLVVFAPSSMSDILSDISKAYEAQTGNRIVVSIAGTPQIARQLEAGAPADYFMTADREWMDWALKRKLVVPDTLQQIASNRLVLAVRNEVENWADPDGLLTSDRFAMAEPESVPAGRYARQALQNRGIWESAKAMAVYGDNVRVTVRRLAMGEVGAAIVYGTDVEAEPQVKPLLTFPPESHDAITYWGAVTSHQAKTKNIKPAKAFAEFLSGANAGALFAKAGFLPPKQAKE